MRQLRSITQSPRPRAPIIPTLRPTRVRRSGSSGDSLPSWLEIPRLRILQDWISSEPLFCLQDMEVSATELMNILNKVVTRHPDLKTDGFGLDTCRSMVAVMDSDTTGKLGFEEFKYLWNNIKKWQAIYKQFDIDRSGTIGSRELPGAFQAAGFHLNEHLYNMIIRRYSDEGGSMDFDNFISCLVRLDAMFRAFKSLDKDGSGQIQVNIQEWLQLTMYS